MAYVNIRISKRLKEELAWDIDKWLWVISNKMLFKTVIPLKTKEQSHFNFKKGMFMFVIVMYELAVYGMVV